MPKVSVIIPNYNHALFLNERIDSVLNQTFQDFEVIILDDCSTDNSKEVIEDYRNHPKISQIIYNELNSGSTFKQWKKGIELAKGDWIWIAESDDVSEPFFLESLLNNKIVNNNVGVIYSQSYDIDENNIILSDRLDYTKDFKPNIWENSFHSEGKIFIQKYLVKKNVIPNTSAVLLKKSPTLLEIIDSKLLSLKMCGDWLFYIRYLNTCDIVFINERLNRFRNHKNVTRNHSTKNKKILRLKEESVVRKELKHQIVKQELYEELLYNEWYKLSKFKSILSIKISNRILLKFIIKKIKNKL